MTDERKARVEVLCVALVKELGLTQGHAEIHCHHGRPKQVVVVDKSLKLEEDGIATSSSVQVVKGKVGS